MDEKQKKQFKEAVHKEMKIIRTEIPRLEKQCEPIAPDASLGRLTRMDNIVNQSVAKKQLSNLKTRLRKLEEALRDVDEDEDFGRCVECDEPIPMARLLAMPETRLCVDCAE
ncbi:TraR/DksA family transcriptional regulator [Pseudodesulfovibrio senegalensis]|uniref:TraR/DksA family transcriptional regulator n=1 Tax=Pseudodesulfovibrio senegalensis TaxID=1721087 RepID=A0A6N6N6F0_9BACT|nr:TraR/DksA C4-type zinc finger protein [Pseudodesulfovibrio senegalensis]KAB1443311.1 TraR/DksA family transcriptional regulator [Pseudodesulfovibrio senegalensis]